MGRPGQGQDRQPQYDREAEARKCYDLAMAHFNAGSWDEAQKAAYQSLTHKWENAQAHRICARAIHLLYSDLDARGVKHLAVDWRRDAITHYRAALQYDPTLKDVSAWLEQLTQEAAEQARQRQATWEAMHPEIQGSRAYNQGLDYLKNGQWREAEHAFRLATTYNPKDPEGWWKLGYVLFRLDRFTGAEQAYIRGIQLDPHHTAYEALAWLYCRMGRFGASDPNEVKGASMPWLPGPDTQARQELKGGLQAAQEGRWQDAIERFKAANRRSPVWPSALFNLGWACDKAGGQTLRAAIWYRAYLAAKPDASDAPAVHKRIGELIAGTEGAVIRIMGMEEEVCRAVPVLYRVAAQHHRIGLPVSIEALQIVRKGSMMGSSNRFGFP